MKKILTLLLAVAILAAAFLTNPPKSRHREVMHEAIQQAAAEYVDRHAGSSALGGFLSGFLSGLASTAISAAIDTQLHYHNFYLFSTCTMKMDGEQKLVSLGLFNHIITMDKDDVLEAIGENPDGNADDTDADDTENV